MSSMIGGWASDWTNALHGFAVLLGIAVLVHEPWR
jgi:hypothetical protein